MRILIFIIFSIYSQCDGDCCIGCLRCINNQCEICDIERYYLTEGKCKEINNIED